MNLNTLKAFRQQVYTCLEQRADALFSLCDGLLSEPQARSLPELSHSPFFERQWPSIYAALADGKIKVDQLQALCVRSVLSELAADAVVWIAVDATPEERPEAHTSEDRGYIHVSNLPLADKPISIGWMFSVVGLLPEQASSWVPPLDFQRISSEQTAVGVAIERLRRLKPLFGTRQVMVVADRWYGTPEMLRDCRELGYRVLIRLKSNRKLYRKPVRRFPLGRPPQDGPLLQGTRPETQFDPSATWEATDEKDRTTRVSRWDCVHFQHAASLGAGARALWAAFLGRASLPFSQTGLALACRTRAHPRTISALELDRGPGLSPVVSGSRIGLACPVAMGSERASDHSPTGSSSDANPFVAAWHTSSSVPTTRKSTRTHQRLPPEASATLSSYS